MHNPKYLKQPHSLPLPSQVPHAAAVTGTATTGATRPHPFPATHPEPPRGHVCPAGAGSGTQIPKHPHFASQSRLAQGSNPCTPAPRLTHALGLRCCPPPTHFFQPCQKKNQLFAVQRFPWQPVFPILLLNSLLAPPGPGRRSPRRSGRSLSAGMEQEVVGPDPHREGWSWGALSQGSLSAWPAWKGDGAAGGESCWNRTKLTRFWTGLYPSMRVPVFPPPCAVPRGVGSLWTLSGVIPWLHSPPGAWQRFEGCFWPMVASPGPSMKPNPVCALGCGIAMSCTSGWHVLRQQSLAPPGFQPEVRNVGIEGNGGAHTDPSPSPELGHRCGAEHGALGSLCTIRACRALDSRVHPQGCVQWDPR